MKACQWEKLLSSLCWFNWIKVCCTKYAYEHMNDDQTYTNPLRKDLKVKLSKSVFDIIFV